MRVWLQVLFVLTSVIIIPSAVAAQGSIAGSVRDASGAVLPGVTVEASSPALIEKTRSVVTDGTGQYKIYLDVKDASGAVQPWGFEAQTPTALIRSGVKPDVFKVGSTVTIRGCHARDATKNEGAAREIILADGRSYIIGPKGNEPDASR